MKIAFFNTKRYEKQAFEEANREGGHEFVWIDLPLRAGTAPLAQGCAAACVFVNDQADAAAIAALAAIGVKMIAARSAGFNHIDVAAAKAAGLVVARVPAYSPYAVAEYTLALMLSLNRHVHRAYNRVREGNFALDGLLGFDMHGRTVGLIGLGKIGACTAKILQGMGCRVIGHDPVSSVPGVTPVALPELLATSDIVSLHCPLTPETRHLINAQSIQQMKRGAMLINTSRGALVDTMAAIEGLKSGQLGSLGIDVYEEEADLFFKDLSETVIQDDVFARLLTFPNVLVTGHQAFFTADALTGIAVTTIGNISEFAATGQCRNAIS
ncbi:MAG: 2-hydroxyacid dehydrogenase [Acidobacteria bacterium]|nr:2-hydroxyacid dehydrogenase [Acidobacteriota bacterium]